MRPRSRSLAFALGLSLGAAALRPVDVSADTKLPTPLANVGYDQHLGEQAPLGLIFRDEAGRPVRLGQYFGERPVVLVLAYYTCPMLCSVVLEGVASSLKVLTFEAGREYDIVVVSFDPRDTPKEASERKRAVLAEGAKPGRDAKAVNAAGWHFLSGSPGSIEALTRAVGFRYYFDEATRQYAHAAGMVVLTPSGRIARYFYGVEYPPRDVRLGLVEASGEKIGSVVDQVLLFCFHYNPVTGRYSAMTLNLVRAGGIATVLGLGLMILLLRRRERHALGAA